MKKGTNYIHIGPPKTATTSLQYYFYKNEFKDLKYEGISQPRNKDLHSKCATLFSMVLKKCRGEVVDQTELDFTQLDHKCTVISEEGFLVDSKSLKWQKKLFHLHGLLKEFDNRLIMVVREPVKSIYSYYKEIYFKLDKKKIRNINEFANSNYCKIYDYQYLLDEIRKIGFKNFIFLDYEKLISGQYTLAEVFKTNSHDVILLERLNESKEKKGKGVAKNFTLKNFLIRSFPRVLKNNIPQAVKILVKKNIPNISLGDLVLEEEIDEEIQAHFLESYQEIKKICL